jgi:hypothetical protein
MCLHPVLGLSTHDLWREWAVAGKRMRGTAPHLRPEVLGVIGTPPDFESDEVVLLVV